jgi:hypothetical protein
MADDSEVTGGGMPMGRTSALDYFKRLNGSIGSSESSEGGGLHVGGKGAQTWWYIYGRQGQRQVLAGPYNKQEEARAAATEKFSGWTYRVLGMPTRDRGRARRILTHQVAQGGQIADSLKKMQREV